MAGIKTTLTTVSPGAFIKAVEDEQQRKDCHELAALMEEVTGEHAQMWGPSIVGCGKYHYKYASGREGDMPLTGFSPRKSSLVLYLGSTIQNKKLMATLGRCKTGKGCLYIKKLDDIDRNVLRSLVEKSVEARRKE
jgi:Domain of unknown function (DU1801)